MERYGYVVLVEGFNKPEEIKARRRRMYTSLKGLWRILVNREKPLSLGISQEGLDPHFIANGLVLQEGLKSYSMKRGSQFHYWELLTYKKE